MSGELQDQVTRCARDAGELVTDVYPDVVAGITEGLVRDAAHAKSCVLGRAHEDASHVIGERHVTLWRGVRRGARPGPAADALADKRA